MVLIDNPMNFPADAFVGSNWYRLGQLEAEAAVKACDGKSKKIGLVQAFMHDPEVLILDEPTSGLDPLLQETFLEMVREVRSAGRTVFMSSHIMSEVQAVADRVAIIREGRMITVDSVTALRERAVRTIEITFDRPAPAADFADLPGVSDITITGPVLRCRLAGSPDALIKAAAKHTVLGLLSEEPDLEELFFTYYRNGTADAAA